MKEKDVQTKFTRWLKKYKQPGGYELKICKTKSMPFSAVKEHQVHFLVKTQVEGIAHKLSDFTPGLKPYDCFFLHAPAYVVVAFWEPRNLRVYMINIDDFLEMRDCSKRKSLTETMARAAGRTINL